jgi:ribonucleoside-diphosphate reductase alpha chain/ribonucleoside-triphosphate reductase
MQSVPLLSDAFTEQYRHQKAPFTELGEFVYLRTYSRYLEQKHRRERWQETVRRAVEYNVGLALKHNPLFSIESLQQEAEALYDNMFHLRQFLSGRTMWVGGEEVAELFPLSNFNCSFTIIDDFESLTEMFYLLMVGAGVGFRTLPEDVAKMSSYRANTNLIIEPYQPLPHDERQDNTSIIMNGNTAIVQIGDSKEGWVGALQHYFQLMMLFVYRDIDTIHINTDNVRPKGERLKRFGGTASGPEVLTKMFEKVHRVMQRAKGKLQPIDALDIANLIAEAVVSGGVRRSSQINLSAKEDEAIAHAKSNLFSQNDDGEWVENKELLHRTNSNNSIFYQVKPTREQLHEDFINMCYTGERGFVNAEAARKRRADFGGFNPCAEILLANKGLCNLVTVNIFAFVENDKLNREKLKRAFVLAARSSLRMTLLQLEIPRWNEQAHKDNIIGVSFTGFFDAMDAIDADYDIQKELLKEWKQAVREAANSYAKELGIRQPLLATTIKPEGTLSKLPTVSSGAHRSHAPYYIRRIRISATDPLAKAAIAMHYPVSPENGQTWADAKTLVIEFPVKSGAKRTKKDVSAIEQLNAYRMFQKYYVEHNTSITISVKDHEWEEAEEWVWRHWDDVVAISFMSLSDAKYPQMPEEEIDEIEYVRRKRAMKPITPDFLKKFEETELELDIGNDGCENGYCPIR